MTISENQPIRVSNLSLAISATHLLLTIQDTGEGIPQETMEKIFDPYFTTKEKGTGLGLSVVHGIVSKSDGQILVETEPGKGSIFKLSFPVWELRAD